jgi:hypothetical protein
LVCHHRKVIQLGCLDYCLSSATGPETVLLNGVTIYPVVSLPVEACKLEEKTEVVSE